MKRTIIALLATAAFAAPALAANAPPQQQPSNPPQQQSQAQPGPDSALNGQASNQQTISPKSLSRSEIREMQSALNKDGFSVGRVDGKWGPRTSQAVQKFDQSKGIQSQKGQLTGNTLAQLGVNTNQQGNSQQPQQNDSGSQNNNH